jgi:hemerythrin
MKKNSGDGMIRIPEYTYEVTRQYCAQFNKNIKEVVDNALIEWFEKHIEKADRKIIDQIISRNKTRSES